MTWRIMVVDDEPDVRAIIVGTLKAKYEVLEAQDGLDALEKVDRMEPDFVLMDVMMPLMNGFEACAALRKNPRYRELPVMFLSALGSQEDMRKGYGAGANLYLTKPFDPSRLLKNIDVYFQTTPPQRQKKRYSFEQLKDFEREGRQPQAPGAAEFDLHRVETVSDATMTPPPPAHPTGAQYAPVPASSEPETLDIPGTPLEHPRASGVVPRVMVVDDDPQIIEVMRLTLDGIAETVSAADGLQAIERLVKYQPDILIIDIMLPKMNGFQLCQSLRLNKAFARLPIIICSAKSSDRDIQFARRVGANDYLVKPFSSQQLIDLAKKTITAPGFAARPKQLRYDEIVAQAIPQEDAFRADSEVSAMEERKGTDRKLTDFLKAEAKRETSPPEEKKKRRFFGFGRREE